MKKIFAILLVIGLMAGCARQLPQVVEPQPQQSQNGEQLPQNQQTATATAPQVDVLELFSDRDYRTEYDKFATVTLNGSTATSDSNAVRIDGSTVTVTDEGTYVLTGTLQGMVIVDAEKTDKIQLVLQNADITNSAGAPLYIRQADKVFITLAETTENTLTAGESFTQLDDNNIDGALFSKADLTFNGFGKLQIQSPGGHGIVCKDSLHFTGSCNMNITSAEHAIEANDEICMDGGSLELTAGKDGLHCENDEDATLGYIYVRNGRLLITCEGDGISAGSWFYAHGGEYKIFAGGGSQNGSKQSSDNWGAFPDTWGGMKPGKGQRPQDGQMPQMPQGGQMSQTQQTTDDSTSMKAIKAGTWLTVKAGVFTLDSADDGLHSDGGMDISGGSIGVLSGDDGLHAEESLTVTGGSILVKESYEALEALQINIHDGVLELNATDDGINAAGGTDQSGLGGRDQWGGGRGGKGGFGSGNGSILVAGGQVKVTASGDAIDSNGTLEITGGSITVCGPTRGDTAVLDYDRSGTISGGTFLGTGGAGMAQTLSGTNQGVLSVRVNNQTAGTTLTITDAAGNVLLTHTPELDYALVVFSSPDVQKGASYTLTLGQTSQTLTAK